MDYDSTFLLQPDTTTDFSDPVFFPPTDFHGFGHETEIPGRLQIKTKLVEGEEVLVGVARGKKRGRPRGPTILDEDLVIEEKLRKTVGCPLPSPTSGWHYKDNKTPGVTPRPENQGSSFRPTHYLLGQAKTSFPFAKIPKTGAVLGKVLSCLGDSALRK
jgi:hypothetical protein